MTDEDEDEDTPEVPWSPEDLVFNWDVTVRQARVILQEDGPEVQDVMARVADNCGEYDDHAQELMVVRGWDAWDRLMAQRGIEKITPPGEYATSADEFEPQGEDD